MKKKMNRREFLKASAAQVAGAVVLTACGGIVPDTAHSKDKLSKIVVDDTNLITTVDMLKEYNAMDFDLRGKRCILLYNNGEIRAFQNICTHKSGPNQLQGEKLVCQWHGATFDPLTGKALSRPAPDGSELPAISLKIEDGKIYAA